MRMYYFSTQFRHLFMLLCLQLRTRQSVLPQEQTAAAGSEASPCASEEKCAIVFLVVVVFSGSGGMA